MRTFKKIMFVILALLPLLSIIACCLQIQVVEEYVPLGTVSIVDNAYVVEPNTWSERLLVPLGIVNTAEEGLWRTTTEFMANLNTLAGIPTSLPMVLCFWYLMYMFVIFIADMVFSLITFVPRKVSEYLSL